MIWTGLFWKKLVESAVKTGAQAGVLVIGADQLNVLNLDWVSFAGFVAGGAVLSALTSLASAPFGPEDSPSVVG